MGRERRLERSCMTRRVLLVEGGVVLLLGRWIRRRVGGSGLRLRLCGGHGELLVLCCMRVLLLLLLLEEVVG